MHIYIFERLEEVSTYYHSGGGLIVVAKSPEHARELVEEANENKDDGYNDIELSEFAFSDGKTLTKSLEVQEDAEPSVMIFPDAGCR